MDTNKEILELKKEYLEKSERLDTKIYFAFLAASFSLFGLSFKQSTLFWGILTIYAAGILFIITVAMGIIIERYRKRQFNKLISEVKNENFSDVD